MHSRELILSVFTESGNSGLRWFYVKNHSKHLMQSAQLIVKSRLKSFKLVRHEIKTLYTRGYLNFPNSHLPRDHVSVLQNLWPAGKGTEQGDPVCKSSLYRSVVPKTTHQAALLKPSNTDLGTEGIEDLQDEAAATPRLWRQGQHLTWELDSQRRIMVPSA